MKKKPLETQFVLCPENGNSENLKKRKSYQVLPDEEAAQEGYLRVAAAYKEDSHGSSARNSSHM